MAPMQSPFPGMDPYLEDPAIWNSVHVRLINAISDYLSPRVLPNFFVDIQQHVYILTPDDLPDTPIVPDIYVVHTPKSSATTTANAITPHTLVVPSHEVEVHEQWIEIRDKQNRTVVTVIELLSPFNKALGTPGYRAFHEKRKKVMTSDAHWIEIDLLRAGARPPEVSGKSHYYTLLKRSDHLLPYEVWYFDLRDSLPTVAVPLRSPFDDVPLDLQDAFADMYRRAYYAESIDYTASVPLPRLRPADAVWVQTQVNNWRQRREA